MDGYEFLNLSLKKITDGDGYVLVISRDGKTLLVGTDNAVNRLIMINGAAPLEHVVRAYRTDHFATLCSAMAVQFRPAADDGFGLWLGVDASRVHAAIAEFDLAMGHRTRIGNIARGNSVWVRDSGSGVVVHISAAGAIRVALDQPLGDAKEVIAREWLVRPYAAAAA